MELKKNHSEAKKIFLKKRFNHGFSLIELMVVIVIIGILTTFAIPSYNRYVEKTEFTNAYNYANSIKPYVLEYALTRSSFKDLSESRLGLEDSEVLTSANIASVNVNPSEGSNLTITFNLSDNVEIGENPRFNLIANYQSGLINWSCQTFGIEDYYVPSNCTRSD